MKIYSELGNLFYNVIYEYPNTSNLLPSNSSNSELKYGEYSFSSNSIFYTGGLSYPYGKKF